MAEIKAGSGHQTVITTFEVTPGSCEDVLEALKSAYADVISKRDGFIAAGLHVNDAQTRICTYSQWRERGDYQAMLRSEAMRERNRVINEMAKGFEPVMYDVVEDY